MWRRKRKRPEPFYLPLNNLGSAPSITSMSITSMGQNLNFGSSVQWTSSGECYVYFAYPPIRALVVTWEIEPHEL